MRNRFFIWAINDALPREFDPLDPDACEGDEDLRYFVGVARELAGLVDDDGTTFLITWHLDRFEDRFEGAVVLLINDEQYQLPAYAGRVRAIFKTGGIVRNPLRDTLRLHPAIASRTLLREARNVARSLQRRLRTPQTRGAPVHQIPLGYLRLADVPEIPFEERPVDVFFAGSIESEHGFTLRPRLVARRQMAAALAEASARLPHLRVDYSNGGPMANPSAMVDGAEYSERLMRARIVLCPRGNFDETFRLMETARSGCVAIAERLPERWYHHDAPVVQIDRWADLTGVLEDLLADPGALAERAADMRRWWDETLGEAAIARYVADRVSSGTVARA